MNATVLSLNGALVAAINTDDEGMVKSTSSSDLTDLTSLPSDSDSITESLSSTIESASSSPISESVGRKSVRFSIVHTREYNVVELPPPDNDDDSYELPRKSLGWEYSDRSSIDIEAHMEDGKKQRKEKYLIMIQDHIQRVEHKREAREEARLRAKNEKKKKGFKNKVLKPMWKGFLEMGSRSVIMMPSQYSS